MKDLSLLVCLLLVSCSSLPLIQGIKSWNYIYYQFLHIYREFVIEPYPGAPAPGIDGLEELSAGLDKNVVTCSLCRTVVNDVVQLLQNNNATDDDIVNYIINTCARLNVFSHPDEVCGGMARIALVLHLIQICTRWIFILSNYSWHTHSQPSSISTVRAELFRVMSAACLYKDKIVPYPIRTYLNGTSSPVQYQNRTPTKPIHHR